MAGIYIHIPFCRQACTYCNFHFSVSLKNKEALINALAKEIMLTDKFDDARIATVYLGGGTPSLLNKNELDIIFSAIKKKFILAEDAEITLEANPDDINEETLQLWKAVGINRLSVGLQSFNDEELKWMNRAHTAAESIRCLEEIKKAGFENYSVDLIYGSPLQSNEDLRKNFEIIAHANVPHISCYALTVEEGTVLNKLIREKKSVSPDPGRQSEQFASLLGMMKAAGYEQYEISNFSKPGMRSKHNSSYWQGKPYYGFGPSAHSFNGISKRRWNIANNSLYIQSIEKGNIPFEEETLSTEQSLNEFVMMALRTVEGLDLEYVKEKFGAADQQRIENAAAKYISAGKMIKGENKLRLTDEGKFFADGIASDLFA